MKQFEVGKTYTTRSACNYDCVFAYTVIKRTAKAITVKSDMSGEQRRGIAPSYCGKYESCKPEGTYSMCPVITAECLPRLGNIGRIEKMYISNASLLLRSVRSCCCEDLVKRSSKRNRRRSTMIDKCKLRIWTSPKLEKLDVDKTLGGGSAQCTETDFSSWHGTCSHPQES